MSVNNAGYIIGAYPCAPSFHQKSEEEEKEFWRQLADTPDIRGLEQPCLEHLHPLGDEWLLRHTPGDWQIVVTAIMETMRRRAANSAFGLASSDEEQRKACVAYYRHLQQKINHINTAHAGKVIALELHAAPNASNPNVAQATDAFARSLKEITSWDWSCDLVLEHCDAMTGIAPRKAFCRWTTCWRSLPGMTSACALTGRDRPLKGRTPPWRWPTRSRPNGLENWAR